MTAQPAGEESRSAPLRHRRSRLQPAFGQIHPSKRPFGALGPNRADIKENVATLEARWEIGSDKSAIRTYPCRRCKTKLVPCCCCSGENVLSMTVFVEAQRQASPLGLPPPLWAALHGPNRVQPSFAIPVHTTPSERRAVRLERDQFGLALGCSPVASAAGHALSGWSGRGHPGEAHECRHADRNGADHRKDHLPSR